MSVDYSEDSKLESAKIADTLKQLDNILANENLKQTYNVDITNLRGDVRKLLSSFNANIVSLDNIEREDVFKTNPMFATQRYQLIKFIEDAKIEFQFKIVPAVDALTRQILSQAKQNPPNFLGNSESSISGTTSTNVPLAEPSKETGKRNILDKVQEFLNQSGKLVEIASKGYLLVKGLGLLVGVQIP